MRGPVELVPEDVLALACKHLEGIRPPRGRRWSPPQGVRVPAGWNFLYRAERLGPQGSPDTGFGSLPGYLVADDGSVRRVGWGEERQVLGLPPVE
jgi:hypothetical protein